MRETIPRGAYAQAAVNMHAAVASADVLNRLARLARRALQVPAVFLLHYHREGVYCVGRDGSDWRVGDAVPNWLANACLGGRTAGDTAASGVSMIDVTPPDGAPLGWARACLSVPVVTPCFTGAWVALDARRRPWNSTEAEVLHDSAVTCRRALAGIAPSPLPPLQPAHGHGANSGQTPTDHGLSGDLASVHSMHDHAASGNISGEAGDGAYANTASDLETLVDEAAAAMQADVGALFYESTQFAADHLPLRAASGASWTLFPPALSRQLLTDAPPGGVLRLSHLDAAGRLGFGALRLRSILIVPVRTGVGDVRGALLFGHSHADHFPTSSTPLALRIARQTATAVENAVLCEHSRRTESLLLEEVEFSAAVANSLAEGVLAFSRDGVMTFCNPTAVALLHSSEEQLLGRSLDDVMVEGLSDILDVLRHGNVLREHPCLLRREDGGEVTAQCSVAPIHGSHGVAGAVLAFNDVSQSRAAERTLLFQKSLLESQTEASVDGILVVSNEGKVLLHNSRFVHLWKVPPELAAERSDEKLLAFVNSQIVDPEEFRARVEYLYRHPYEESREKITLHDGRIFDRYSAPVKGENQSLYGRVWFFRDISEQMHALHKVEELAEELANQQEWLNNLLNLLPVPVLLVDPQRLQVVFANKAAGRFASGAFPRIPLCEVTDPDLAHFVETFGPPARQAAMGMHFSSMLTEWRGDGVAKTLLLHSELLPDRAGQRAIVVLAFDDVTELKHVQSELQQAVRVRDEFLSIASHELKTPVTALHLQIQSVLRMSQRNAAKTTLEWALTKVGRAEAQVLRLIRLIDNLLDVSRITAGRLEFEPEQLDLAEVALEAAERLRDEAARVGSELRVHTVEPVMGVWDRLRLEQVITNLLSNAVKYGDGKPIDMRIHVIDGDLARLSVQDYGIGITEENQARIFERFERAVSERQYGGLGLGLWITRQIVEALRGRVYVESWPGHGSLFTVDLPRVPSAAENTAPELHAGELPSL